MLANYEIRDGRFENLVLGNCHLDQLYTGCRWAEGPCYFKDGRFLIWSDIPNNRMLRWTEGGHVEVFRSPSNCTNGNTRDREGRLVSCEHFSRRVTRTELDGSLTVLCDAHQGRRLNSPNDVVVRRDGSIWFTDPPYGILSHYEGKKAPSEQDGNHVWRLSPDRSQLAPVAVDFDCPNGLAFSPDERTLIVADSGKPRHLRRFVVSGDRLTDSSVFAVCEHGVFDGIRFDMDGNLWASTAIGLACYAPDGVLLGYIRVPETVANLTFGGEKGNRVFITATTSVYAIYVNAQGAQSP